MAPKLGWPVTMATIGADRKESYFEGLWANTVPSSSRIATSSASDRHIQIAKWIRENLPETSHLYDIWHIAKVATVKPTRSVPMGLAQTANDGADRVPWFGRVITTDLTKQRLTFRWHVLNKDGVNEREVLDGKPLKDEYVRYDEILTTVQLTDSMTLPEEEMSKAWNAL
ncbi:hypothetical protein Bbelb_051710 [Branchiostoma belcheri]|nr:hypothetical protein Bbelb_051710 [Branchiostoma belcheri]